MKNIVTCTLLFLLSQLSLAQTSGKLDTTFNPGTSVNSVVESIAVQSDQKIIIGGTFKSYNGTSINGIARLEADGSLDTSFKPGTGIQGLVNGQQYHVYDLAIQSDGKIVVVGAFNKFNGNTANDIVRLNADGSMDTDFKPGSATGNGNEVINCVALQSDGKIVIGGSFNNFNGLSGSSKTNKITRLNPDGSLDTSFDEGEGANSSVRDLDIQADGKIILVGDFTSYDGETHNRIVRINPNGSIDANFKTGTGIGGPFPSTRVVAIQTDGKVLIAGSFGSYDDTDRGKIARVNTNGSLDESFDPGKGADLNSINELAILSNGQVIIGGGFYNYDKTSRNSITRILSDGSLDGTFDPGFACDNTVEALAVQADGKVLIGGNFTKYDGTSRLRLARIHNDVGASGISGFTSKPRLIVYPNPSNGTFHINTAVSGLQYQVVDVFGAVIIDWSDSDTLDLSNAPAGYYFLETNLGQHVKLLLE